MFPQWYLVTETACARSMASELERRKPRRNIGKQNPASTQSFQRKILSIIEDEPLHFLHICARPNPC